MAIDTQKCIYHREGKCYFLVSSPTKCEFCPNFVSADSSLRREYKISKPIITYYDIITSNPSYKKIFEGKGIQKTLF